MHAAIDFSRLMFLHNSFGSCPISGLEIIAV